MLYLSLWGKKLEPSTPLVFSYRFLPFLMVDFNSSLFTFYFIYTDITFFLSTSLLFIVLFCIIKKSQTIGIYKYYMMYTVIASYAFDIVCWVWKPIPLFPLPAIASEKLFYSLGSGTGYTMFTLFAVGTTHYLLGLSMSILYRYVQVKEFNFFIEISDLLNFLDFSWKITKICQRVKMDHIHFLYLPYILLLDLRYSLSVHTLYQWANLPPIGFKQHYTRRYPRT